MRESRTLEWKADISKTFLKTVSAYANYGTGRIVFGVNDHGIPIGLENLEDAALRIENAINDALDPVPDYHLTLNEADKTIELVVERGSSTPYTYHGKAYRRSDTSSVEVGRVEYNRLIMTGMNLTFDALEARSSTLKFNRLEQEMHEKLGLASLDNNALVSLELLMPSGAYTIAAELLADENPFNGIDIARFGNSLNIIMSRHTFERESLFRQLDEALAVFDEHYTYEEIVGFERIKRELVPREAFREALANALAHRQWDSTSYIQIAMFPDRIEITSPGGLPQGMDKEKYLAGGRSVPRNPIIASVFYRLGYIERFGTGVPRIMQEYADLEISPRFEIFDGSITVVLPCAIALDLTKDEKKALETINKGEETTRAKLEESLGFSRAKTVAILNRFVEKGLLTKEGNGRNIHYFRP